MKKILEYVTLSASAAELIWKVISIVIVVAGGSAAGVLAVGTEWFKRIGPLSWFCVALLAALMIAAVLYLVAAAARERASAALKTAMALRPSTINPLLKSFEDMIIPVEFLRLPGVSMHEYKSFRRCKFVGPGALAIMGGTFLRCDFNNVGYLIPLPDKTFLTGVTALKGCMLENCEFISVTLLVPMKAAVEMKKAMPTMEIAGH